MRQGKLKQTGLKPGWLHGRSCTVYSWASTKHTFATAGSIVRGETQLTVLPVAKKYIMVAHYMLCPNKKNNVRSLKPHIML